MTNATIPESFRQQINELEAAWRHDAEDLGAASSDTDLLARMLQAGVGAPALGLFVRLNNVEVPSEGSFAAQLIDGIPLTVDPHGWVACETEFDEGLWEGLSSPNREHLAGLAVDLLGTDPEVSRSALDEAMHQAAEAFEKQECLGVACASATMLRTAIRAARTIRVLTPNDPAAFEALVTRTVRALV